MVTKYEREYFAKTGYHDYRDYDAHQKRVEKMILIAKPTSVLDCGCAYGFIVRRLLDLGIYAVGIDISSWCEKMSKNIIPNNFIRHDLRQPFPFRDKEFDLIYCEGVLEHIGEEHIPVIMKEFDRVSWERIIQVSFSNHKNVAETEGHVCLKDNGWWASVIPKYTWLAFQEASIENNELWIYKA